MNDERLFNEEMDQGALFRIKGHHYGDNLSCLNVMYHKRTRDDEGKLGPDSIDIIYKDLDTGEKGVHHINNPKYVVHPTGVFIPKNFLILASISYKLYV